MMREILFRGKRKGNGEWICGDLIHDWSDHNTKPVIKIYNNTGSFTVIPETVGQYTGLTDKNGKRIFEGDIFKSVLYWNDTQKNGVVVFRDEAFGFIWYRGDVEMYHAFPCVINVVYDVIGNIHDNPELLKGGAEG